MTSVDADHVLRLIAARVPEIAPSDRDLIEVNSPAQTAAAIAAIAAGKFKPRRAA
jgi:hypothetical protein